MDSSISVSLLDVLVSLWCEICFLVLFGFGSFVVRKYVWKNDKASPKRVAKNNTIPAQAIQSHMSAGEMHEVVKLWRRYKDRVPAGIDTIHAVVCALAAVSPDTLVDEVIGHLQDHNIYKAEAGVAALGALSDCNNTGLVEDMHLALFKRLNIRRTPQIYEALLGAYASAGDQEHVKMLIEEIHSSGHKLTGRAHVAIIKGFLKQGLLDPSLEAIQSMLLQSLVPPPFVLESLFTIASEAGRSIEVFNAVYAEVPIPTKVAVYLLEDCMKTCNVQFAQKVETFMRAGQDALPPAILTRLLKLYASTADMRALEIFQEVRKSGITLSVGLSVGILSGCADSKNSAFVEEFANFINSQPEVNADIYPALQRAYEKCGLFDRACALYDELKARDFQLGEAMVNSLMKCAFEAGRTDLLQTLCDENAKSTTGFNRYLFLIRSAGRTKDVSRAFAILDQMSQKDPDLVNSHAYNCVLDVCVRAGELKRARALLESMRKVKMLDIVSFNTMLKGLSAAQDVAGLEEVLSEVEREGLRPDCISYNCLISAAASAGVFNKVWATVETMERSGMSADSSTISILMKALKNCGRSNDLTRALALADRIDIDICSNSPLLCMSLAACLRNRALQPLRSLVACWEGLKVQPCTRTCASLISAYSALKDLESCWMLWQGLTADRGLEPDAGLLGCMLDALGSNGKVTDAVKLTAEWQKLVGTNVIVYSTLIKGFAVEGRAEEAMEMWRRIRSAGVQLNTVIYNTLIDVAARVGDMAKARELWKGMEEDAVLPDAITNCIFVKGLCMQGDLDEAFKVFRAVLKTGLVVDGLYNTVLDACVQHKRMDLADKVLEDMDHNSVVPTHFTIGILVKMYCRRSELEKAFKVVEELSEKHKLAPNKQVQTLLMSGCFSVGKWERGLQMFDDMKKMGAGFVDAKTYSVVISALVRRKRVRQAVEFLEEAYGLRDGKRKLSPKENISERDLKPLLNALCAAGQRGTGLELLHGLCAAGAPVTSDLLGFAGDRYIKAEM